MLFTDWKKKQHEKWEGMGVGNNRLQLRPGLLYSVFMDPGNRVRHGRVKYGRVQSTMNVALNFPSWSRCCRPEELVDCASLCCTTDVVPYMYQTL
ncbi:hypothetical protein PoB_000732800 [Plakobranchus ocellatus]|uniref:Uncharacterized protein n=1 Tax=Plakobranchus ocellatus TaxID=259542 RepID=A0AAV3YEB8_9GAST|nr:hypothetical protein PoB_000732800 [Plakobranchus ocellatus]